MERIVHVHHPDTFPENLFIKNIWYVKDLHAVLRTEKILPKGTAEIIFNLSDGITAYKTETKSIIKLPRYFINGVNFTPIQLSITDKQHSLGIQLNGFALKYIFGIPAIEFNDKVLEGSKVCKSLDLLADQLQESLTFDHQVKAISNWLRSKINNISIADVKTRIIQLDSDPAIINLSVKDISEKYNITSRHLSRLSLEYLGMSTEDMILYKKYLSALHKIHLTGKSLSEITFECGFYDQSHFSRTFKIFTDLTPKQYQKTIGELPGHIIQLLDNNSLSENGSFIRDKIIV